jgi:hypothetical protein
MVSVIHSEAVAQHLFDVKSRLMVEIEKLYGDGCCLYCKALGFTFFGRFYGLNEGCALSVYLGGSVVQFYRHLADGSSVVVEFGVGVKVGVGLLGTGVNV